jgi:hypothetical protein
VPETETPFRIKPLTILAVATAVVLIVVAVVYFDDESSEARAGVLRPRGPRVDRGVVLDRRHARQVLTLIHNASR